MAKLRVPTLQHLARNWCREPRFTASALVRLAENPPRFSYNPLFKAVRDLLILGVSYDQVVDGIRRTKRESVRNNLLSVMPLIREYFHDIRPDFCQSVERRYYPVARELMVPFEPPLIYGVSGQIYFPWFSFWRSNPLADERLSLFVTLVEEVLLQDADLETAQFDILDFSAPDAKSERELTVINAQNVPRVSDARKEQMLSIFAEGDFQALDTLAERSPSTQDDWHSQQPDPNQTSFPGF